MSLAEFRENVNNGNDYSGWTVTLMKDIDFEGAEWVPIGRASGSEVDLANDKPFSGIGAAFCLPGK